MADSHAYAGRCFICESSTSDSAKGYVEKEQGYWKDDPRMGNVFVKISELEVLTEAPKDHTMEKVAT